MKNNKDLTRYRITQTTYHNLLHHEEPIIEVWHEKTLANFCQTPALRWLKTEPDEFPVAIHKVNNREVQTIVEPINAADIY